MITLLRGVWHRYRLFKRSSNCKSIFLCVSNEHSFVTAAKSISQNCEFTYVETIPVGLETNKTINETSTAATWMKLIEVATTSIDIVSFYWSLLPEDTGSYSDESCQPGIDVYKGLINAAKRGIKIRVMQDAQKKNNETQYLANNGLAEVRSLKFSQWFSGGVLHTKLWLVDKKHFYIGSANLDWRSLSQVKELGVVVYDCQTLADDLSKIVEVYWQLGEPSAKLPSNWSNSLATKYNASNPMLVPLNEMMSAVYFSSSPPASCPTGRMKDLDAILDTIRAAKEFVHVSVMDYFPTTLYMKVNRYWPKIDDALRSAAFNGVQVRLLISNWTHTRSNIFGYLQSLVDITPSMPCRIYSAASKKRAVCQKQGSIEVRIYVVPTFGNQSEIPFARVNHAKYMVTESTAYIGTSNWSGDYFISTGGLGMTIKSANSTIQSAIVNELNEDIFMRDWMSAYATPLLEFKCKGPRNGA